MHPSLAAVAAIRAKVTDWTPSSPAIAAALNAPSTANPAGQSTVPRPFTVAALSATLDATAMTALLACPAFPTILSAINSGDVAATNLWATTLHTSGKFTDQQYSDIAAIVNATQADPTYQAQISWAMATLGRPVDAADIEEARP